MSRQTEGQSSLDLGATTRRPAAVVERKASADLRELRHQLPAGTAALQAAYKLLAAEIDAAHRQGDRYGVINASRELLRVREALAPTTAPETGQTVEDFLAGLGVA